MHDPYIQIYHCRFFTLWHVDPCTDGTDDSCGWCYPKPTVKDREYIDFLRKNDHLWDQWNTLAGQDRDGAHWFTVAVLTFIVHHMFNSRDWCLWFMLLPKTREFMRDLSYNPVDSLDIHTADPSDRDQFERAIYNIHKCWRRYRRPWHKHPKYHFWHWKITF